MFRAYAHNTPRGKGNSRGRIPRRERVFVGLTRRSPKAEAPRSISIGSRFSLRNRRGIFRARRGAFAFPTIPKLAQEADQRRPFDAKATALRGDPPAPIRRVLPRAMGLSKGRHADPNALPSGQSRDLKPMAAAAGAGSPASRVTRHGCALQRGARRNERDGRCSESRERRSPRGSPLPPPG